MRRPSYLTNPRSALTIAVVIAAAGAGITVWALQGAGAAQEALPTVEAKRGNVILSVGGVGKIVQKGGKAAAAAANQTTDTGATGIYPRVAGRIAQVLVEPGQAVAKGQALALIDDGGTSAGALVQAKQELRVAEVELQQKQTSDPVNGPPPTRAEIDAAVQAAASARTRLNRLYAPPSRAERAAADAEVVKAEADLAVLLQRQPGPLPQAISAARSAVTAAKHRLAVLKGPRDSVAITNAKADLARAEADLALLERAPQGPLPEEIAAAQRAISSWQQKLTLYKAAGDTIAAVDAQLELDRSFSELAKLQRVPAGPLPAEIAAARTAVERARANLARAQAPPTAAELSAAQFEYDRAVAELATLQRPQAPPSSAMIASAKKVLSLARIKRALLGKPLPQDVATARYEVKRTQAELALLRARGGPARATDIELARLKVEAAKTRVASAGQALKKLRVVSPFEGTVTSVFAVPGIPVDGQLPVATIADLEELEAVIDLSEFDVAQVKKGLKAQVGIDALGGENVPGKVVFTALTGSSSGGGVVTFPVRVSLADSEGLKPGMNVSVRIIVDSRKNVLQLPLDAVTIDDEDRSTVTVLTPAGTTVTRRVKLGLVSNNNAEILKGVKPGEEVMIVETQAAGEEE